MTPLEYIAYHGFEIVCGCILIVALALAAVFITRPEALL